MSFKKQLVLLTKIDPEKLKFKISSKENTDQGRKFFTMYYNGKLINIQLPKLIAPFGLSGYTNDSGDTNYSITLELPEDSEAYNILQAIQTKALEFVVENADQFYKTKKNLENVAAFGKEFIKENEESSYPSSISIKMKLDKNNPENFLAKADIITLLEDEEPLVEENLILNIDTGLEYITKRCEVQAVINAYGYQVDTKYGLSLKAERLRVFTSGNEGDAFLPESEPESEPEPEEVKVEKVEEVKVESEVEVKPKKSNKKTKKETEAI